MDSAKPLEPASVGGIAFAGQACPVSQGGGDTYPLFLGENRVAVATPVTMVKCGATNLIEVLLRRQDPLISRERTRRRRHPKMGDAAQGGLHWFWLQSRMGV